MSPGPVADFDALRRAARARAASRAPGPAMPTADVALAAVPVRVYHPSPHPAVTVVYLHGGGFVLGDLDTHDAQVRRLAHATSATVVAVHYRRAPEHPFPAAVDDAVAVVQDLASTPGTRLAVAGDSAGGLIAVLAALRLRCAVPLVAQLLVCPNIDPALRSPSVTEWGSGPFLDATRLRHWISSWLPPARHDSPSANPLVADLRGTPPTLLATAGQDPLCDEGAAYAARLRAYGVPVTHHHEPGLPHNFPTLRDRFPSAAEAEDRFLTTAARLLRRTT